MKHLDITLCRTVKFGVYFPSIPEFLSVTTPLVSEAIRVSRSYRPKSLDYTLIHTFVSAQAIFESSSLPSVDGFAEPIFCLVCSGNVLFLLLLVNIEAAMRLFFTLQTKSTDPARVER